MSRDVISYNVAFWQELKPASAASFSLETPNAVPSVIKA